MGKGEASMRRVVFFLLLPLVIAAIGCATTSPGEDLARRGLYLDAHPKLPPALRAAVESGHLIAGMSREMVLASVGWPQRTERAGAPHSTYECWVYGDDGRASVITYLYFGGEVLLGFEQREVPTLAVAMARIGVQTADANLTRQEVSWLGTK
jgi:hypothetical protein